MRLQKDEHREYPPVVLVGGHQAELVQEAAYDPANTFNRNVNIAAAGSRSPGN